MRTVVRVRTENDDPWMLPVELDVLPADGPGGLVAPAGPLTCVEVLPPDHDDLLGPELAGTWKMIRDHHRDRLSSAIAAGKLTDVHPSYGEPGDPILPVRPYRDPFEETAY